MLTYYGSYVHVSIASDVKKLDWLRLNPVA